MGNLSPKLKYVEIIFIVISIASLLIPEFIILTLPVLLILGIASSFFAIKEKLYYIPVINLLVVICLSAFYFIAW
ncbi:MAG: hypothetical protein RR618_09960 [Cellulosilyticaceae bacterium]